MTDETLGSLLDERDIRRVIVAVARAQDARDWTAYRDCFSDRVEVQQPMASGADGVELTGSEWAARAAATLDGFDLTQHCLFNIDVELDGAEAHVQVDLIALHELRDAAPEDVYTLGGRYHMRLHKDGAGWRIAARRLEVTYETGNTSLMQRARERVAAAQST